MVVLDFASTGNFWDANDGFAYKQSLLDFHTLCSGDGCFEFSLLR